MLYDTDLRISSREHYVFVLRKLFTIMKGLENVDIQFGMQRH